MKDLHTRGGELRRKRKNGGRRWPSPHAWGDRARRASFRRWCGRPHTVAVNRCLGMGACFGLCRPYTRVGVNRPPVCACQMRLTLDLSRVVAELEAMVKVKENV